MAHSKVSLSPKRSSSVRRLAGRSSEIDGRPLRRMGRVPWGTRLWVPRLCQPCRVQIQHYLSLRTAHRAVAPNFNRPRPGHSAMPPTPGNPRHQLSEAVPSE